MRAHSFSSSNTLKAPKFWPLEPMPLSYASLFGFSLGPPPIPSPQVDAAACCWATNTSRTSWTRTNLREIGTTFACLLRSTLLFFSLPSNHLSHPLCSHLVLLKPCGHLFDYHFPFYALRASIAGVLCSVHFQLHHPPPHPPWTHNFLPRTLSGL